jgi:hypothetical protein
VPISVSDSSQIEAIEGCSMRRVFLYIVFLALALSSAAEASTSAFGDPNSPRALRIQEILRDSSRTDSAKIEILSALTKSMSPNGFVKIDSMKEQDALAVVNLLTLSPETPDKSDIYRLSLSAAVTEVNAENEISENKCRQANRYVMLFSGIAAFWVRPVMRSVSYGSALLTPTFFPGCKDTIKVVVTK